MGFTSLLRSKILLPVNNYWRSNELTLTNDRSRNARYPSAPKDIIAEELTSRFGNTRVKLYEGLAAVGFL